MLSLLFDLLVPPRASERIVRELTLEGLRALAPYGEELPYHDPRVTALVWELKYYGSRRAAALAAAFLSEQIIAAASDELGKSLLLPVPMHPARRRERGANQAQVLCEALLGEAGSFVEYVPHALARVKDTPMQRGLEREARMHNVKDSMRAHACVAGRACIVVDDVTTTGATLEEAKRALRAAEARSVQTITLARS